MLDFSQYLSSISSTVDQWAKYLVTQGLSKAWADRAASLYLLLHAYGLRPVLTSIYRSPEKQAAMRAAYLAGNKQGLRYLPAKNSDHTHQETNWLGQKIPASFAMDIDLLSNAYDSGAIVAHALGLHTGHEIGDDVHYFYRQ
jgi:hypothetical protein